MHRSLLVLLCLAACQSPAPAPSGGVPPASGVHFQFSAAPPESGLQEVRNWCTHAFHEAVRLDAGGTDSNRRVFALGSGVHRIVVDAGGQTASFMLKRGPAKAVEVYTSVNFPVCLSNRTNFTIDAGNGSLHYDNGKHIQFTATVEEQTNGVTVGLETAPGAGYGFLVHRCEDCE